MGMIQIPHIIRFQEGCNLQTRTWIPVKSIRVGIMIQVCSLMSSTDPPRE